MYIYNLGQAFEAVCRQNQNKTAIIFDGRSSISFGDLNDLANRIVNFLLAKGMKRADVIAIQNSKSPAGFAAMLACLKLGIIYTNFDYTNPVERIRKIFQTAQPALVLADTYNRDIERLCGELCITYVELAKETQGPGCEKGAVDQELSALVCGSDPAYIMFTSGSTGIPKGVLISQKSLLNFIRWGRAAYGLEQEDIMTNVNPIYFDNSVFDFYCSVFNGITMAAFSAQMVADPKEMLHMIEKTGCTFWFSVPSMLIYLTNLKLLTKERLKKIRIFSFGGEGYPKELLRKLYGIYGDSAKFYNVYGPTEGTCICSAYRIKKEDMEEDGLAPLGRIAPNFDYVIMNEKGEAAEAGELCLMGEQLALGYYNDEERTEKSFVRYQGTKSYYARMYKTGDLVEMRKGKLYFVGRVDNQIKHMGYRIELEEIENALVKIGGVKQCVVLHMTSRNKFSRLVAFIAAEEEREAACIRSELKKYLPDYMIPNDFMFMDELPKNLNGKVDRERMQRILQNKKR